MAAMRTCLDELLEHWGLDAAIQRTLSRSAHPVDQMGWARRVQASYPPELLRAGRSGVVNIRLIIGADGKPVSCMSNKDSPDRAFEEHACETTMRAARFEPALDASGAPVASYFTTVIAYQAFR
jgi:TonB family protein